MTTHNHADVAPEPVETTTHNPKETGADRNPGDLTEEHQRVLQDYAAELEAQPDLSRHTRLAYTAALRRWLMWMDDPLTEPSWSGDPLADVAARKNAVIDWRQAALTGQVRDRGGVGFTTLSEGTVKATIAGLSDFYLRRGLGPISTKEVKRPVPAKRAPKALRDRERIRWDREADRIDSARDKAILGMMRYAGLRREEVTALKLDDVTLSARKGSVRVYGKGGKVRHVPAGTKLRELLQGWLDERQHWVGRDNTSAFFVTSRAPARALSPRTINDIVGQVAHTAHLDDVGPHTLRHTFATELLRDQGVDVVTVADLLGHSSVDTTRLYASASDADLQAAVDRIDTSHLN